MEEKEKANVDWVKLWQIRQFDQESSQQQEEIAMMAFICD
jgi:hypothetical protein